MRCSGVAGGSVRIKLTCMVVPCHQSRDIYIGQPVTDPGWGRLVTLSEGRGTLIDIT